MTAIITKYIKNKNGSRKGVLVGLRVENEILIGWSQCNIYYDNFCREKGLEIALGRGDKYFNAAFETVSEKFTVDIDKLMGDFVYRCHNYFKDGVYPKWTMVY